MNGMVNYGILQPNVGNALAAGYQQAEDRRNALMQQQQQRQIGDIQLQNALREQRMAEEEGAAYKAAGSDTARLQSELAGRGLGKQAMAVAAQLSKQQAEKLAMLKTSTELMKQAATSIMANPTLETALGTLQSFAQRTGADVSNDIALVQSLGNDPAKIRQWAAGHAMDADKLLPKFQQFDQGGAVITGAVDPLTGQFRQGTAYQKSMAPGEAERIAISRGQLGVAQAGLALRQQELAQGATRPVFKDGQWITPPTGMAPGEVREVVSPTATKDAKEALNLIEQATKLIPKATGSYLGNALDTVVQAVGVATPGAKTTAQLRALEGALVSKMPKMSGPQSDKDVALYKQMAGDIGNPNVPPVIKMQALQTIKEIQQRYAGVPSASNIDALLDKYK